MTAFDESSIACPPILRLVLTGEDVTPDWQDSAACRGMDVNLFFPGKGQPATEAKKVCAVCPVRAECYEEGRNHAAGIWGGVASKGRRPRRRAS